MILGCALRRQEQGSLVLCQERDVSGLLDVSETVVL